MLGQPTDINLTVTKILNNVFSTCIPTYTYDHNIFIGSLDTFNQFNITVLNYSILNLTPPPPPC